MSVSYTHLDVYKRQNQNHARSVCWKMSDESIGLKVPMGKGSRLIVLHRTELLLLVNANKPTYHTCEIDTIAMAHVHHVVRLSLYHCHYNPIELVLAQVKSYVTERNSTIRIVDVERLTHKTIDSIKTSEWAGCVRHPER